VTAPRQDTAPVAPYLPRTSLDAELAALGYAAVSGWPDQRPITAALVRSRLRPAGHAAATMLATHRDSAGRLVGAAALRWPSYPDTPGRLWGPIVHPAHRHQGIGTRLLTALATRIGDCVILTAEIPTRRADTLRFYQTAGWHDAGTATLLKRRLPLPATADLPPDLRLRFPRPREDLTGPLARLAATADPSSPAAADTFSRWSADERYTPAGLALADHHGRLTGVALAYPLAHSDAVEPAEVLLADLIAAPDNDTTALRGALITAALHQAATTVDATVARAVVGAPTLVKLLNELGFSHVDEVRYLRHPATAGSATQPTHRDRP
jgi:GNAT superfamily N-acetyltransferase